MIRLGINNQLTPSLGLGFSRGRGLGGGGEVNLLSSSNDLSAAPWVASEATIAANQGIAPDGTNTAAKLTENTLSGRHLLTQSTPLTIGSVYRYRAYFKNGGRDRLMIREGTTSGLFAVFDASDASVAATNGTSVSCVSQGNGWVLATMTFTAPATANTAIALIMTPDAVTTYAGTIYTGNGASGILIWKPSLVKVS